MLFVRNVTGTLGMLLKQLDEAVAENKDVELRSFAVFLPDDGEGADDSDGARAKLKEFAEKFEISENVPLLIPADPAKLDPYRIDPDAEVTVLLYRKYRVVGNFAFKAGELTEPGVKAIMAALPQIIPAQETLQREAKEAEEAVLKRKQEAERLETAKKENE